MASAAFPQQSLADVFECPVCLASFKDPRVLPACGHTFCKECIEKVHDNGTVNCPTCRKVSGGVEKIIQISDLAKAFIVVELQERRFKEKRKEKIVHFCACCSKKAEPAKYYCSKCQLCLCDSCEGQHQEGPLFAGHGTEPLDRITFCKVHESLQVRYICRRCNEFICSGCAISKHNGHAAVDINIEAANRRQAGADMISEQKKQREANNQKIGKAIQYFTDQERDMKDADKYIRSIEEVAVIFIKQLQTQRKMIKSAQNVNREATDEFFRKVWQKSMAIRRDQFKVNEILVLSEKMTDCQVIDKFQELRELDTDYDKEEDNIPVFNQIQAIGEDVRSSLSTLINSVQQNFPANPNAEPSLLTTASSSKRQAEHSSTHQQKRTKTAHGENEEKQQPSQHSSPN